MSDLMHAAPPSAATVDFPFEGELIFSPHYTVRATARDASAVELSIDGGHWRPFREAGGHWWFDWSGYAPGAHVLSARVHKQDGTTEALRPRALRVALPPVGAPGLQESPAVGSAIERALWTIRNQKVQFVQLWFTDVGGKPWRIGLPIDHIDEGAFTSGVTLDGPSTSKRFPSYITLVPDTGSIFRDPLALVPTAALFCDVVEPTEAGASALGVRQVLRETVNSLNRIDGLTLTIGAEPEFFLVDKAGKPVPEPGVWDFIHELAKALETAGIRSEGFRFGPAQGQGRVQMHWADPVRTADHVVLYRWLAGVIADRKGLSVTFRPQLEGKTAGASMPTHHSLWAGIENVFHDPDGWSYFSERGRFYAGGLLRHAGALAALTSTTTASYPVRAGAGPYRLKPLLSANDPEALCRVPERMLNPSARRLKFRGADAQGNPYLTLAAMIAAGIDGLRERTEPPIDATTQAMPQSLDEALGALDRDREFLHKAGFSDRLIDAWIEERRERPDKGALDA